jgi:hypothetical protein
VIEMGDGSMTKCGKIDKRFGSMRTITVQQLKLLAPSRKHPLALCTKHPHTSSLCAFNSQLGLLMNFACTLCDHFECCNTLEACVTCGRILQKCVFGTILFDT